MNRSCNRFSRKYIVQSSSCTPAQHYDDYDDDEEEEDGDEDYPDYRGVASW